MTAKANPSSPKILSVKWGKMEVEDIGLGKDFKLWPGGGRSWNWSEHGTGHSAGIQPGDCRELLEHDCEVIVLSRGMFKRLRIPKETMAYLEDNHIQIHTEETKKAVQLYNKLVDQGKAVGGLFHTTC
ncbi:MAG: Mth938-like domain-containing protein [Desulfocapsaceae bacterium]|nr:Mth938-like domain-containing protein [Desulfocapsaceae bacterium]